MARVSAGGGSGVGPGEISREGGWESESWDKFDRFIIGALPSTMTVVGSGIGPIGGWVGGVGTGGIWVFFGLLT